MCVHMCAHTRVGNGVRKEPERPVFTCLLGNGAWAWATGLLSTQCAAFKGNIESSLTTVTLSPPNYGWCPVASECLPGCSVHTFLRLSSPTGLGIRVCFLLETTKP